MHCNLCSSSCTLGGEIRCIYGKEKRDDDWIGNMNCKNCKHYVPCNKFDDDLKPIEGEFERFGECEHPKHVVGDPADWGLKRFICAPMEGGLIVTNGHYECMGTAILNVDKEFGCKNFEKRKK